MIFPKIAESPPAYKAALAVCGRVLILTFTNNTPEAATEQKADRMAQGKR